MQALVYEGKGKMVLRNVPKPRPAAGEVLLKVKSVGICGTDLHIYNGGMPSVKPKTIIGHEFSGQVVALGKGVTTLKRGDRVVAEHVVTCSRCHYCRHGRPELCLKRTVLGMDRPGALSEYMVVPANLAYPFPKSITWDEAAVIEPLTIGLFAIHQAGFLLEKKVAVIGQGPIGIVLDQVLTAAGAHVIGIDVQSNRLAFAKKHGWVRETLNSGDKDFAKKFLAKYPLGVDQSFEAVGREATAELCIDITRRGGKVTILGVFEKPATLDLMMVIKKELNLFGSWTCAFSFPAAIEMVAEKKIDLKSLVTHRYALADGAKAFADSFQYTEGRIKSVIQVSK